MIDPIDLLGVHPGGALLRDADPRDYTTDMPEIAQASMPFDWSIGFDVEQDTGIAVTRKDQGTSGSCGGQSIAAAAQSLGASYLGQNAEKSAKAYYAQVFVPGGGSNSRALGNILAKQGLYLEEHVPSYTGNRQPPTEAFMERFGDIGQIARNDAADADGLFAYAFPALDIDAIAQAARDHKGVFIGVHGFNNGTWLSPYPSPAAAGDPWAHFMAVLGAKLLNGKKYLKCLQSWGESAPDTTQVQWLSEDHFTYGRLWDAIAFIYGAMPAATGHVFNTDMRFGDQSEDVRQAQMLFARDGVFNLTATGFYGPVTAQAVLKFRVKHAVSSITDPQGHSIGPATRAVMNTL